MREREFFQRERGSNCFEIKMYWREKLSENLDDFFVFANAAFTGLKKYVTERLALSCFH